MLATWKHKSKIFGETNSILGTWIASDMQHRDAKTKWQHEWLICRVNVAAMECFFCLLTLECGSKQNQQHSGLRHNKKFKKSCRSAGDETSYSTYVISGLLHKSQHLTTGNIKKMDVVLEEATKVILHLWENLKIARWNITLLKHRQLRQTQ